MTIPAIAPLLSFLLLEPDPEPLLPEPDEPELDVVRVAGRAITCGDAVSSKTHCETLKVRLS